MQNWLPWLLTATLAVSLALFYVLALMIRLSHGERLPVSAGDPLGTSLPYLEVLAAVVLLFSMFTPLVYLVVGGLAVALGPRDRQSWSGAIVYVLAYIAWYLWLELDPGGVIGSFWN